MQTPSIALGLALFLTLGSTAEAQRARCGMPHRQPLLPGQAVAPSDCGYFTNVPQVEYEPTFFYDIPVVFHVIQDTSGQGFLSQAKLAEQIDVLNEDFQALPGSLGAPGTPGKIRFRLADTDPAGNPTAGITYSTNNSWFQDSGSYWNTLAWDTSRYLNIYTNAVPCCFGYVADFPSTGIVGQDHDRVVLWWEAVGRTPTAGWPQNRGRTATHEVGHSLGLYHTFEGGCGSATDCYDTGDLICDTARESTDTFGCPSSKSSCGSPDPIHNYMDYSDDPCLWEFTQEQVNRMRCTLENWRPDLATVFPAQELARAGAPPNPLALLPGQTSEPRAGAVWDPLIDHASFVPGSVLDVLGVSLQPTNLPLGPAGTLLCDAPLIVTSFASAPGAPFVIAVPNQTNLLGLAFCAQGASLSASGDLALTNALDCLIGN